MIHFLLFYRIILYSFGFGVLVVALYKYYSTRNSIILAFLLFWSSMTLLALAYVIDFYVIKNTSIGMFSFAYIFVQIGALLVSASLPYFVHKLFRIQNRSAVYLFCAISSLLMVCIILPISSAWTQRVVDIIMITIVISNFYSFILSIISIFRLKIIKDKLIGFSFILFYLILFSLLIVIDIYPSGKNGDFLIFPLLYTFVGLFFIIFGYRKFQQSKDPINSIPDDFIKKFTLTKREVEVMLLLIDGIQYKIIADQLFISLNTVNTHIRNIYRKTKTSNKIELRKSIANFY